MLGRLRPIVATLNPTTDVCRDQTAGLSSRPEAALTKSTAHGCEELIGLRAVEWREKIDRLSRLMARWGYGRTFRAETLRPPLEKL